jgi:hypothetical protein
VGVDKTIDTRKYTIVSLMPGMVSIQLQLKIIEILLRDIARILLKGYVY